MYAPERQAAITAAIASAGRASVADLAQHFDVTPETIRRDFDLLERAGLLRRVHGGAVAPGRASAVERTVSQRTDVAADAKRRIATAALRFVPTAADTAIVLDAGTTVGALAALLVQWQGERMGDALPVITHSITAAATLLAAENIDLHVLGGRVRGVTGAAVGPAALGQLDRFRPDVAFIGTNALSVDGGLTTPDEYEAAVKSAVVRRSARVIVLADSAKFGLDNLVVFADLGDVDVLITDASPDAELASALHEAGVEVVVA